jgi:uncharacterized oligopeptide transporter (OPT) family protein
MAASGLASDYTILENNCTQSIATAAGYVATPAVLQSGGLHAGHRHHPALVATDGLDLRGRADRRADRLPDEAALHQRRSAPFPEGRACGVVLDSLYTGDAGEGMFKAKLLGVVGGFTALYQAWSATAG